MGSYKVIQDIEAEDKILGPLTLRQFIFALIAAFLFYLNFIFVVKGAAFLTILFVPPALFFGFFAMPFGRDQPTEVWALAKIRFYIKPRQRIWNQSGVKQLVTITAPKRIIRPLTKGYSEQEVDSRLKALANTIDSRGWAVKNVNLNTYTVPQVMAQTSDRLVAVGALPQAVPAADVRATDDIMDLASNPVAQQFQAMIDQSSQQHRQAVQQQLSGQAAQPSDTNYWFMNNSSQATPIDTSPKAAQLNPADEAKMSAELRSHQTLPANNLRAVKTHHKTKKPSSKPAASPPPPMTAQSNPAILSLASNDDLSVATLAREAKRAKGQDDAEGEVVVPLR